MKLTERQCRAFRPADKIQKYSDGRGLSLVVHPNGSKYWHGRYRVNGKEQTKSLGSYPDVSLAQARELWQTFRAGDEQSSTTVTVRDMYEHYLATRQNTGSIKYFAAKWIPEWLFNTRIDELTVSDIATCMRYIIDNGPKSAPAKYAKLITAFCEDAVNNGYIEISPAYRIRKLVPSYEETHHTSMSCESISAFVASINARLERKTSVLRAIATLFNLLLPLRKNEMKTLYWADFNPELTVCTIPGTRMKTGRTFETPISRQVRELLMDIERKYPQVFCEGSILVNPINPTQELAISHTIHGNRSLFMVAAQEKLGYPFDVADRQLAHAPSGRTRKAYDRGTFWEQRVKLMQDWADYVEEQCRGLDGGIFKYRDYI